MDYTHANRRFGIAWALFALAVALHVTDEATHDFLTTYNASVLAIRARLPFLTMPTFTFPVWIAGLIAGILLLLCLSLLAFRGNRALKLIALPLGLIVGVFNAALHISSSVYFHRWMPGVYSSPVLLVAALFLLYAAWLAREPKAHVTFRET
jgi:Na+/proline symporter